MSVTQEPEVVISQDVKELFEKSTVPLPAFKNFEVRGITLELFNTAIQSMMSKAYYHGQLSGFKEARETVETIFNG